MITHITDVLKIPGTSHKNLDFANVRLAPDTKLFIDPCLIAIDLSEWAKHANQTINSFFDKFYSLYKNHASDEEKLKLFAHFHEINATHLGYGNGNNGKAKTPSGMLESFMPVTVLLETGIPLSKAYDLPLFIRNIAEDCLSDMLTNILLKCLIDFTVDQCKKYNIPTESAPNGLFYWDAHRGDWAEYEGQCLIVDGKLLLIVPKRVVRNRYYFSTNEYFRNAILSRLQKESSWIDRDGKERHKTKKELAKRLLDGNTKPTVVKQLTSKDPSYLSEYHNSLTLRYSNKGLSDMDLDNRL